MIYTHYPIQKLVSLVCLFFAVSLLNAQILQVTDATQAPFTPQNLISNIFLGDGVTVTNITYKGAPKAVGYFKGGLQSVGIERGIVMTTGQVETAGNNYGCTEDGGVFASNANNSNASDPNLSAVTTGTLFDVAVYQISFIPTADTLRFRYCFGSEEYPEYACSLFNDIFGFFIQGPGFPTPTNIALIPGTALPVTINNLHPMNGSGCPPLNAQYYLDNLGSNKQPVYDGITQVFTAEAVVTPCQEYTITLAISDVGDGAFDSGVFLEAKSFGTGSLRAEVTTTSPDGVLVEGCAGGALTFRLPSPQATDFSIDYTIFGSAQNGVDYQTIPAGLVIPAGQTELVIPIIALQDNLVESQEILGFDFRRDICKRDTLYVSLKDNGLLPPSLRPDTSICQIATPLQLNGTLPITYPPPPSFTNTSDYQIPFLFGPVFSPINVFGVKPATLAPSVIRSVCLNIQHSWDDDVDMYLISPGGQFIELSTDNGGSGDNYTNTCFTPTATKKINFPGPFAPASATPFTGDWLPEGDWTDLYGNFPTNGTWQLQLRDDALGNVGNLRDWTITFEPTYKVDYQWTPTAGVSCPTCPITNVSTTQSTTYTVVASDSYGCTVTDSVRIDILPRIAAPKVNCTSFGTGMASFDWNSVPNATTFEVNVNGTGWVPASGMLMHNVSGLPNNAPVSLEVRGINPAYQCAADIGTGVCCQKPAPAIAIQDVVCFGGTSGSIQLTPDGTNPPYSYNLGTQTNATGLFNNLMSGIYTVTITDGAGCSNTLPLTVASLPALTGATTLVQPVSCFGGDNGQLSVAPAGGTAAYTYVWSGTSAQNTAIASNLSAGTYTVTITDANSCTSTATGLVTQPINLVINALAAISPCYNAPGGSASATGSGGVGPYLYAWSNGVNSAQNPNLLAGNYTVTLTDANACAKTAFVTVGQAPQINLTVSGAPVGCSGGNDGSAIANPSGGTGAFTYKWNTTPVQTTQTATGLFSQNYLVTVTDANGCSATQGVSIAAPTALAATTSQVNVNCNNTSTASASVVPQGGTAPYTYIWSDPLAQTTATATNLSAGTYTVTITDAKACSFTRILTLTEPAALQLVMTPTDAFCFGNKDGKIEVFANGGTTPYQFAWNSGEKTQNIINKPAATYTITLTDAQGCTLVVSDSIGQPTAIIVNVADQPVRCFGEASGSISLDIYGGTPGYTYNWSGPNAFTANQKLIFGLFAGNYLATVTDIKGCTVQLTQAITQPAAALVIQLPEFADTICFAAKDGRAGVQIYGGTAPFAYQWEGDNQNQTTPIATGLGTGVYSVTVTDANLCTQTGSTIVTQKDQLFAVGAYDNPRCYNGRDGAAYLSGIFYGASAADASGFVYQWSTNPPQTKAKATGLSALQSYTVTLTDDQGCSATAEVTLGNPDSVQAKIASIEPVKCHGEASGKAFGVGQGGTAPYQYFWSPGAAVQTDSAATGLRAGTYFLTVTDANGCPDFTSVVIPEPTQLRADVYPIAVKCYGDATGGAYAVPKGGVGPYQFAWSTGGSSDTIRELIAGPIWVNITDQNGCITPKSLEIPQPAAPLDGTTVTENPGCYGGRDGKITFTGAGGTPPYRYALNDLPFIGASVQIGLTAGRYIPKVIDRNGCIAKLDTVVMSQPDQVIVDLGPDFTLELGRDTQLNAQVLHGIDPVQFSWNLTDSVWLSCLTCPDPLVQKLLRQRWFKVNVVDANGCEAEDRILISVERPRRIFVPTGFSPNGDLENDRLVVHGQNSAKIKSFRLYDRWGEMIFEAKDIAVNDVAAGWDGSFRGKAMDPGVFVWVVEAEYLDGETEILHGDTTLIR